MRGGGLSGQGRVGVGAGVQIDGQRGRTLRSHLGAGYIHLTQSFSILAALWGLVSVAFLVLSCIPSLSSPGRGPLVSAFTAFAAGKDSGLHLGIRDWCVPAEDLSNSLLVPSPLCNGGHGGLHQ